MNSTPAAFIAQQLAKLTGDAPFNPCLFAVLQVVSDIARAKIHPTRPVRFVAAFPTGGANDIVASRVAQ
jgi:tripartite-type tricarboxylate transporter receptor subunit TctC